MIPLTCTTLESLLQLPRSSVLCALYCLITVENTLLKMKSFTVSAFAMILMLAGQGEQVFTATHRFPLANPPPFSVACQGSFPDPPHSPCAVRRYRRYPELHGDGTSRSTQQHAGGCGESFPLHLPSFLFADVSPSFLSARRSATPLVRISKCVSNRY